MIRLACARRAGIDCEGEPVLGGSVGLAKQSGTVKSMYASEIFTTVRGLG